MKIRTSEKDEKFRQPFPLPIGRFLVAIIGIETRDSKAGSKYLSWRLLCIQGGQKGTILETPTTLIEDKRWSFAQIMNAIGIKRGEDGLYTFEKKDLLGKKMFIRVNARKEAQYTNYGVGSFEPYFEPEQVLKHILGVSENGKEKENTGN
jgi:hypothetical protein